MTTIGINRRRVNANSDDFEYFIGDFNRTWYSEATVRAAYDALVAETNRFASRNVSRAWARLIEARHPLFKDCSCCGMGFYITPDGDCSYCKGAKQICCRN